MTRFRATVLALVLGATFNFVGCFDHGGGPCTKEAAMAGGGTSTIVC